MDTIVSGDANFDEPDGDEKMTPLMVAATLAALPAARDLIDLLLKKGASMVEENTSAKYAASIV